MTETTLLLARVGFSAVWAAASVYLAAAARRLFVGQRDWIARGLTTEGEVVALEAASSTGDPARRKFYAPVITFHAGPGDARRFTSSRSSDAPDRYTIGQRVAVRYLPDDPEKVDLDEMTRNWWPFAALVVATVVTFLIATLPFLLGPPAAR